MGDIYLEQVNITKAVNDVVTAVDILTGKVKELDEKLDNPKPIIVAADTRPIQGIVRKGMTDINLTVGTKPQPVVKKFQLLAIPGTGRKTVLQNRFWAMVPFPGPDALNNKPIQFLRALER